MEGWPNRQRERGTHTEDVGGWGRLGVQQVGIERRSRSRGGGHFLFGGCEGGLLAHGPRWSKTTRPLALGLLVGTMGPPQGSSIGHPGGGCRHELASESARRADAATRRIVLRRVVMLFGERGYVIL